MGYQKIENLYKNQDVLLFKECYVLEKIHGTSAHIKWGGNFEDPQRNITFFSGGAAYELFFDLFDVEKLVTKFTELAIPEVTIYGEAYGGGCQGMREFYGDKLKFIAFEVKIGDCWLDVPKAAEFVKAFDLEFVWYTRCPTDLVTLDAYRDTHSRTAHKNTGIVKAGEGVVIRPIIELTKNNGKRVMAKHKGAEFSETKQVRTVNRSADQLKVLAVVKDICIEWVTENRLSNILSRRHTYNSELLSLSHIPVLINLMIEDVIVEGKGELVDSKALRSAICRETALMVKRRVQNELSQKV